MPPLSEGWQPNSPMQHQKVIQVTTFGSVFHEHAMPSNSGKRRSFAKIKSPLKKKNFRSSGRGEGEGGHR